MQNALVVLARLGDLLLDLPYTLNPIDPYRPLKGTL